MNALETLKPYMFTVDKVQYKNPRVEDVRRNARQHTQSNSSVYIPKQRDPLFWCFYIVLHGMLQYQQVNNKHFVIEKEFKYASISLIRERADELKMHKLKKTEVEDALANKPKITLNALHALCIVYDVSLMYTKDAIYYEFSNGEGASEHLIVDNGTGRPGVYTSDDVKTYCANIRKGRWHITDASKPIRAISAYNVGTLREFCEKLNIDYEGLKKQDMYQKIREKIGY
jgi:hypothetical protein